MIRNDALLASPGADPLREDDDESSVGTGEGESRTKNLEYDSGIHNYPGYY